MKAALAQTMTSDPAASFGVVRRACACGQGNLAAQEECEECRKKDETPLQRFPADASGGLSIGAADDPLEREADQIAAAVVDGSQLPLFSAESGPRLRRQAGIIPTGPLDLGDTSAARRHALPPRQPRALFRPNACVTGPACTPPIPGSAWDFSHRTTQQEEANAQQRARDPRAQRERGRPRLAVNLEAFARNEQAEVPGPLPRLVVNPDLAGTGAGGQLTSCAAIGDPHSTCIEVPHTLDAEAAQFNAGRAETIGGRSRAEWRFSALRVLVHEVAHQRFDEAPQEGLARHDEIVQFELSEMAAQLAEIPLAFRHLALIEPTAQEAEERFEQGVRRYVTNPGEGIRGILMKLRCSHSCAAVDTHVRAVFRRETASWPPGLTARVLRILTDPDLGLNWPVALAPAGVERPLPEHPGTAGQRLYQPRSEFSGDEMELSRQAETPSTGTVGTAPPQVHAALSASGRPLDSGVRQAMESRFGYDFSGVRLHTDPAAADSARAVNARAYTVGQHVVFGPGQFQPTSRAGQRLLAHELAHVVQCAPQSGPKKGVVPRHSESARRSGSARVVRRQVPPGPSGPLSAPPGMQEIPVEYVLEPVVDAGGGVGASAGGASTSLGMSLHVLASGDLSWLQPSAAASRVMSAEYWSPLVPSRGAITLDRVLNNLPRNLAPRIEGELASGQALTWVRGVGQAQHTFTQAELLSIPSLARRFNAGDVLSQAEISLLARATEIHVSGSTPGSPFVSYTEPNFPISFQNRYRVRVEIPRGNVLDVTQTNAITELWVRELPNVDEMEFMAVANHEGRIVSVELTHGRTQPGPLLRYSGAIRWGGRLLVVAGPAISAYRIGAAAPEERVAVAAEEGGGMLGGAAGTALATAGCVALGVATGGVGLFVCGLVGGIVGGVAGSTLAGGVAREMQRGGSGSSSRTGSSPCPSCHALQREWDARRASAQLQVAPAGALGFGMPETLSAQGQAPGSRALTPQELELIRQWLQQPAPTR